MAFASITRFSRAGRHTLVLQDGTTAVLTAARGDFLVQPMRQRGVGFMAADVPLVVAKNQYGAEILRALEGVFPLSALPLEQGRTYREPRWSLQIHSASVHLLADGSVDVRSAHGGRGYDTSVPYRSHVCPERYRSDVPRRILEALGERPEDIPKLLGQGR